MKCPKCQTENSDAARFCMNCGIRLGASAAEPSSPEAGAGEPGLDRFIPRELMQKLEAARTHQAMAGERRVITMLFCDVKGSTAAAEKLDPETWTEIISGVFEYMIRPIYKYEGLVPRLMGDAILAFFGAPIGHEDDPQRAVLAGLEIQEEVRQYVEEVRLTHGVEFGLRVGINTGLVVVGEIGSDLRMEYTAMGDAINLAARMEQTAAVGTIQISEETYKLVAPFFEVEPLGEVDVKGKSARVKTYRVLGARAAPGQLRGLKGLSSPLVGREEELALLHERLAELAEGAGSIVAVVGEAGLGKSTLINQLRRESPHTDLVWLQGDALSYARSISYFSWRQILRQSIGAEEGDSPDQARAKLARVSGDAAPFLEAILAVEGEESRELLGGLEGDALRNRIVDGVRSHIGGLAQAGPLVIAFDDLHWADEASLNLLVSLVDLPGDLPLLFILMLRPDRQAPAWTALAGMRVASRAQYYEIEVEPLPAKATEVLLTNLIGVDGVSRAIRETIVEKAGGNPFFVEELLRSLIETEQIVRENGHWRVVNPDATFSLPNSLRGVLGARIDRLPESSRHVLQNASVLGRTFDLRVLRRLTVANGALDQQIGALQDAGLIEPAGNEFVFRHVLIQEAAYDSILIRNRAELHRKIGEVLEDLYSERIAERAAMVAHHFHAAGDPRSMKYDVIVGENAARVYANVEAAIHFGRALKVAQQDPVEPEQVSTLFKRRGAALELAGRYEQALGNYLDMEAFGREVGETVVEMSALMAQATMYSTYTSLHDPSKSEDALMKALDLSRLLGDRAAQARLHWNLMLNFLYSSRLGRALEHGEQALPLARGLSDREPLAYVLNDLCRLYVCLGRMPDAHAVISEARELWRELGNQAMLADSLGSEAEAYFQSGRHDEALELTAQGLALSEEIDNLWGTAYNRMLMSFIHFDRGEIGRGILLSRASIEDGERGGLVASTTSHLAELGWFQGFYGDMEGGLELAQQALERADEKQPGFRTLPIAFLVRLNLLRGDVEAAARLAGPDPLQPISIPYMRYTISVRLANVDLALARGQTESALRLATELLAESMGITRVDVPDVLRRKADALIGLERLEEAYAALSQAREHAIEMGSRHHLWPIFATLSELCTRLGKGEQANSYRLEARRIVEWIAGGLVQVGLKDAFLNDIRVRHLFD